MKGELTPKKIQEGALLDMPQEVVVGAEVEIYLCVPQSDDLLDAKWTWRRAVIVFVLELRGGFGVQDVGKRWPDASQHMCQMEPCRDILNADKTVFAPWRWPRGG